MRACLISALLAASAMAAGGSDYDYKKNGADWGTIHDGKYGLCDSGREQSPINLVGGEPNREMELLGYNYYDFAAWGIDPDVKASPAMTVSFYGNESSFAQQQKAELELKSYDGQTYNFTPLQFHFHAPSEHAVDGELYDLEVHFVHYYKGTESNEDGIGLGAVIGVFFDREAGGNQDNAFITEYMKARETADDVDGDQSLIGLQRFFSMVDFSDYWSYAGSLTTPPCTEGIKWSVVKSVQPISDAQLKLFTENLADDQDWSEGKGNNRVTMPLNERNLYRSFRVSSDEAPVMEESELPPPRQGAAQTQQQMQPQQQQYVQQPVAVELLVSNSGATQLLAGAAAAFMGFTALSF